MEATSVGDWVDAGPFRAHLRHVMAAGDLTVLEAATLFGLSVRAVTHIVHGRAGRAQRRISPDTARRLLQISTTEVAGLRWCLTPTEPARTALRQLRGAGWTDLEIAAELRAPLAELTVLEREPRCSRLLTVRLVSLVRGLTDGCGDGGLDHGEQRRAA